MYPPVGFVMDAGQNGTTVPKRPVTVGEGFKPSPTPFGLFYGNETSAVCTAWTPDLGGKMPPSPGKRTKTGGRGWGVGGRYLKNDAKQAEGGLVGFDKNGVSYVSLPTSHTQHYVSPAKRPLWPREPGPMPRPESTV